MRIDNAHCYSIMTSSAAAPSQRKRATNLSLSEEVLTQARALDINLSQACEQHLRQLIRQERERRWRADHAEFIASYNATIERDGLPLDEWRTF